jgi:hypothetical protein
VNATTTVLTAPQPDANGEFATPADGAKFMASFGIPQVRLDGKNPAVNGSGWQDKGTTDPTEIDAIALRYPGCNFGSLSKAVIGGYYALETDSTDVKKRFVADTGLPTFGAKLLNKSGEGRAHWWFKHTAESILLANISQDDAEGFSLRLNNQQCVSPGSIHPVRKTQYANILNSPPEPACPELLEWFRVQKAKVKERAQKQEQKRNQNGKIDHGAMYHALMSEIGSLRRRGYSDQATEDAIILWADDNCEPPIDYEKIKGYVRWGAERWEQGNPAASTVYSSAKPADEQIADNSDIESIRELVDLLVYSNAETRKAANRGLPSNSKKAVNYAIQIICNHVKTRGRIFNADNVGYILLNGKENDPVKVSPDNAVFCNLLTEYGILPGQDEFVKLGKFIGMKAAVEGIQATVRHSSYYNAVTKSFYFAESDSIIRGDGTKLERVSNGTDGVLFVFEDQDEFKINLDHLPSVKNSLIPGKDSLLMKMLFKDLVFKQGQLTDMDKHILLTVYAMLLILPGIIKGRPVLQMLGESGCGKSFFLMLFGRAIVGSKFTLQAMPSDKEQFENILVNSDIAFFDNVSKVDSKIHDAICSAVTGYDVVRRELFTTMEQIKVPSKTTIGLSALVPVLTTVEQANRSICLSLLERTEGNLDEDAMLKAFDAQRGALMAEIIQRAQMVLQALSAQASYVPRVKNRLAGVATLILRVARHEGWEEEAKSMLNAWNEEQLDKALDYDEFSERVIVWMQNPEWKGGITYSAGKLNDALSVLPNMGETDWKGSRSLSVLIQKSKAAYERRFGLIIGEDKRARQATFTFNPSQEFLDEIRGVIPVEMRPEEPVDLDAGQPTGATAQPETDDGKWF